MNKQYFFALFLFALNTLSAQPVFEKVESAVIAKDTVPVVTIVDNDPVNLPNLHLVVSPICFDVAVGSFARGFFYNAALQYRYADKFALDVNYGHNYPTVPRSEDRLDLAVTGESLLAEKPLYSANATVFVWNKPLNAPYGIKIYSELDKNGYRHNRVVQQAGIVNRLLGIRAGYETGSRLDWAYYKLQDTAASQIGRVLVEYDMVSFGSSVTHLAKMSVDAKGYKRGRRFGSTVFYGDALLGLRWLAKTSLFTESGYRYAAVKETKIEPFGFRIGWAMLPSDKFDFTYGIEAGSHPGFGTFGDNLYLQVKLSCSVGFKIGKNN